MQQPRVRRARGVQHGHPVRRRRPQRLDNLANHAADLVVGVGCVDDPRRGCDGCRRVRRELQHGERALNRLVGPLHAGHRGDDGEIARLGKCLHHPHLGLGQRLRQVQHASAQLRMTDVLGRRVQDVSRVVPVLAHRAVDRIVQRDQIGRDRRRAADGTQRGLAQIAKFGVRLGQGAHRRRMIGDLRELARTLGQRLAPSRRHHRTRGGPARREGRCREPLGQPRERRDLDARDPPGSADTGRETAPGDDARHVVRRDDRHGRHRVGLLGVGDDGGERVQGISTVSGRHDANRHQHPLPSNRAHRCCAAVDRSNAWSCAGATRHVAAGGCADQQYRFPAEITRFRQRIG